MKPRSLGKVITESVGGTLYNSIEDLRYAIRYEIPDATGGNISKKDAEEMSKELDKFKKYLKRKLKGKGLIGW